MASLTDCKGMSVLDATPSGCAGRAIQDNFVELANRIVPCKYTASVPPGSDDDNDSTTGETGISFSIGSQWLDTDEGTKGKLWVCVKATKGQAKWLPIEEWESSVTATGNKIARRNSSGDLCAGTLRAGNVCASVNVRAAFVCVTDDVIANGEVCGKSCVTSGGDMCADGTVWASESVCACEGVRAKCGNVHAGCHVCANYNIQANYCICGNRFIGECGHFQTLTYCTSDPSFVLYYPESRNSIVGLSKRSIPPERSDGAAVFYNKDTSAFEVYKMAEGKFCSMSGELLETLPEPEIASGDDVEEVYRFDSRTGTVVKRQQLRLEKTRLKRGYAVDPVSGKILREEDGAEVDVSEAVELKRRREAQSLAEKIAQRQQKRQQKKASRKPKEDPQQ